MTRPTVLHLLCRSLFVAFLAGSCPAADVHSKAILIGIKDYPDDQLTGLLPYADMDAQSFDDEIARTAFGTHVLLNKPRDGTFTTTWALNKVLLQAQPGDTVYIFISSKGIARPGATDGYIGTSNLVTQKPESTAVSVSYIRQLIEHSHASRVILFADVNRPLTQIRFVNQINILMADLGTARGPAVAGILASAPGQLSQVNDTFKHGVFGYYLVDTGKHGSPDLANLLSALRDKVSQITQGRQKPEQFGMDKATLWKVAAARAPDHWQPSFASYPRMFASNTFLTGLLALPSPVARRQKLVNIREQLERSSETLDTEKLAADIVDLKNNVPADQWSDTRDVAMTTFADLGQKYISRYGMQDMLPDDPLRVTDAQWQRAAKAFRSALRLAPDDPEFADYRQMLQVRMIFCEGRPGVYGYVKLAGAAVGLPEVENALGIDDLEGSSKNYQSAESHFKNAKAASPGWLYPRHNLALTYIEQGNYRDAESEYREAIASLSPYPYIHYNYALLLQRLHRFNEARTEYDRALKGYDSTIELLRQHGREWHEQLPTDSALAFQRAGVFQKNKAEVFNAWGTLLEARHDVNGAIEKYQVASKSNEHLWPPLYNLAKLEQTREERHDRRAVSTGAVKLLKQCVELAADVHPRLLLADLYLRSGDSTAARLQLKKAHEEFPDNTPVLIGLAAVDRTEKKLPSAIQQLQDAISIQIRNSFKDRTSTQKAEGRKKVSRPILAPPELYVDLAELYRAAGMAPDCRSSYETATVARQLGSFDLGARALRQRAGRCAVPPKEPYPLHFGAP